MPTVFENRALRKIFGSKYMGDDKSLARPISRCILFDGESISFVAVACFLPGRATDLSAPS